MSVSRISPENQHIRRRTVTANSTGRSQFGEGVGRGGAGRGAEAGMLLRRRGMESAASDLLVEPVDIRIGFGIPAHVKFQPLARAVHIAEARVQIAQAA